MMTILTIFVDDKDQGDVLVACSPLDCAFYDECIPGCRINFMCTSTVKVCEVMHIVCENKLYTYFYIVLNFLNILILTTTYMSN